MRPSGALCVRERHTCTGAFAHLKEHNNGPLQMLRHPNIVRLIDAFEDEDCVYLVRRLTWHRLSPRHHMRCLATTPHSIPTPPQHPQVLELCTGGELFDQITAKQQHTEQEAAAIVRPPALHPPSPLLSHTRLWVLLAATHTPGCHPVLPQARRCASRLEA